MRYFRKINRLLIFLVGIFSLLFFLFINVFKECDVNKQSISELCKQWNYIYNIIRNNQPSILTSLIGSLILYLIIEGLKAFNESRSKSVEEDHFPYERIDPDQLSSYSDTAYIQYEDKEMAKVLTSLKDIDKRRILVV